LIAKGNVLVYLTLRWQSKYIENTYVDFLDWWR